jgi:hypothetical protein
MPALGVLSVLSSGATSGVPLPGPQDKVRVVIAAVLNTSDPRFANADKDDVRSLSAKVASERLRKALVDARYDVPDAEETEAAAKRLALDFTKGKDRSKNSLRKLGDEMKAGFVVLAWITDVGQENFEASAVLSNLSGPASLTKAKVKIWLLDVPAGRMTLDGKAFDGEAKGPRFGTTKRGELSGNPQDVAAAIMQENKRRAEWMGRAAMAAVDAAMGSALGLKGG